MFKILKFFNLLDNKHLSLTNILFYVSLVMYTIHPQYETISGLLIATLNYSHKRYVNDKRSQTNDAVKESLEQQVNQVKDDIKTVIDASNKSMDSVAKVVSDVNDKLKNYASAMSIQELGIGNDKL